MLVVDEKYIQGKVKEFNCLVNSNFWGWQNTKRRCASHSYSLYKYQFCYEKGEKRIICNFI